MSDEAETGPYPYVPRLASLSTRMINDELTALEQKNERLKAAYSKTNDAVCQELGKVLGYPWFKDDQKNFPGATEKEGVCIGEHVAESIAAEAATRIKNLEAKLAKYEALTHQLNTAWMGGWDTVEQVHEAREAVANLVRQLEKE